MSGFRSILSPFYQQLLPKDILKFGIRETKITCENCNRADGRYRGKYPYQSDLKCCTFHPFLPNYLLGAILTDVRLVEAHEVIQERIARKDSVFPMGLVAPFQYQKSFRVHHKRDFGQNPKWLCPFYNFELRNCRIWPYRGVVCTSYHCQSSYGHNGKLFWKRFENYLSLVEMSLMEEVLARRGYLPAEIMEQMEFLNAKKEVSRADFDRFWSCYESPAEFYKKSYELVLTMRRKDLRPILGELGKKLEQNLVDQYSRCVGKKI